MHDKKGREIELGDYLKVLRIKKEIGIVTMLNPSTETCNVLTAHMVPYSPNETQYSSANEAEIVLKHDGTDPV